MKYIFLIAVVLAACGNAVVQSKYASAIIPKGEFEPIAVIELFTSQGCSSCPPADQLLAKTISGAKKENKNIFALSFHVDYWNRLGWADPFSKKEFSLRQNNYINALGLNGAYTPQMIVNGTKEFVGSDKAALTAALDHALHTGATANFTSLTADYNAGKNVQVQFATAGVVTGSTINFALVSLAETTVVRRGENGGRTLTNENIVRQLIIKKAAATGEVEFASGLVPVIDNAAVIAFVQEEKSFKIIGAAMTKINFHN